jgi:3-deoxy-7-phosphoheptulonate synthase
MTKLESRPILGKPWEYMFYVDVEVPQESSLFYKTTEELGTEAASFRILGVYHG